MKVILNELKRKEKESASDIVKDIGLQSSNRIGFKNGCQRDEIDVKANEETDTKKLSKRKIVANAFFLDVVADYIKVVMKDRKHNKRWILLSFLLLAAVANAWPYNKGVA